MVLEQLRDGASRHLQAYDEGTRQLIYILCLPLIDGVFASLLVSGAMTTFSAVIATSLTVFSGAGALAVLYSNADTVQDARNMVLRAAPFLLVGAVLVGIVAPIYAEMFNLSLLKYATGLTLISIAAQIAEIDYADKFPPHAIIATGLILSVQTPAALALSLSYLPNALITAAVAIGTLYVASSLSRYDLNLRYIRLGGAMALTIIGISLFVQVPSDASLVVLGLSFIASAR